MKYAKFVPGLVPALLLACAFALPVNAAPRQQVGMLKPAATAPRAEQLRPGLRVAYIPGFVRHIDEIESRKGVRDGGILRMLDWNDSEGEVMTSGRSDGVAAIITGYINFNRTGEFVLAMQSNDGARLTIGGELIIDDPDVHPERFSPNAVIEIEQAGWYALRLLYFERKGSSTMELYWQPPGTDGFDYVPAEAFAHKASE